jgi:hypothetical protein
MIYLWTGPFAAGIFNKVHVRDAISLAKTVRAKPLACAILGALSTVRHPESDFFNLAKSTAG